MDTSRNWRIVGLFVAASLGWWSAVGLDYVATQAAQKNVAIEADVWAAEVTVDSHDLTGSPG